MHDLRLVAGLRWRQMRDLIVWGLRMLGYSSGEWGYLLYLVGLFALWAFAMWAYAVEQAVGLGDIIRPQDLVGFMNGIPWFVLIVQVYVLVMALRSTPLKLSFPDMSYLAGSPVNRAAPILFGFLMQTLTRILLMIIPLALLAILFGRVSQLETESGWLALYAIGTTIPLIMLTWGLAWLFGIQRLIVPQVGRIGGLWLLPLLLIPLATVLPDPLLLPGRMIVLAIFGAIPAWMPLLMLLVAALVVAALYYYGRRINMIHAVDESILHARLAALGWLAWQDPTLQMRIRTQSNQGPRGARFRLPKGQGWSVVLMRASLSYVRHPIMLMITIVWGVAMSWAASQIILYEQPFQLWIGWVLLAAVAPPVGLLHVFRTDLEEPFLRQMLPFNGMALLIADAALPYIGLTAGALFTWLAVVPDPDLQVLGISFIPLVSGLLLMCCAQAMTTDRVLQRRLLNVSLTFGLVIGAGAAFESIAVSALLAVLAAMFLSGLLIQDA